MQHPYPPAAIRYRKCFSHSYTPPVKDSVSQGFSCSSHSYTPSVNFILQLCRKSKDALRTFPDFPHFSTSSDYTVHIKIMLYPRESSVWATRELSLGTLRKSFALSRVHLRFILLAAHLLNQEKDLEFLLNVNLVGVTE